MYLLYIFDSIQTSFGIHESFSARSVVTTGPNINVWKLCVQVGTLPYQVPSLNIFLQSLVILFGRAMM